MAADYIHAARAGLPPDAQRAAVLLERELERFENLLEDLLEISRFDAGVINLEPVEVDLKGCRRGSTPSTRSPTAQGRRRPRGGPRHRRLSADYSRSDRVFSNLVKNIEHTVEGGSGSKSLARPRRGRHRRRRGRGHPGRGPAPHLERFYRADVHRARPSAVPGRRHRSRTEPALAHRCAERGRPGLDLHRHPAGHRSRPSRRTARWPSRSLSRRLSRGRRRWVAVLFVLRPTAALVALLGLAACTAGVPQTGDVVSVSPVTTSVPQEDADALEDLGALSPGQSEVEVVTGYMRAMSTGDVSRIRRWVTTGAQGQVARWSRPATTGCTACLPAAGPRGRAAGRPGQGQAGRPAQGRPRLVPGHREDVLTLVLENDGDGADVRVANPGGIWMGRRLRQAVRPTEVYLVPDTSRLSPQLSPVPVFVPGRRRPGGVRARVKHALELLLSGPRGRYDSLDTAIPPGTELREFEYAENVATVDLSEPFAEQGRRAPVSCGSDRSSTR